MKHKSPRRNAGSAIQAAGLVAALCICGSARAESICIGILSYDTFIPAGTGSPGVFAFDLANFTGVYSLPTDFPVIDSLTFDSAALTLTLSDLSQEVIDLGDIGPGFLLDGSGNPILQAPGDTIFNSAEFTATLSPTTFMLDDGSEFTADSNLIDAILLPSSGPGLTVDVDQTAIGVSGTVAASAPEPSSAGSCVAGLLALAWAIRRRRFRPAAQNQEAQ